MIPKKNRPVPAFVHINFRPNVPDSYQPTEELVDAGYAVLSFCYIKEYSEDDISSYRTKFETRLKTLLAENAVELNPNMVLTECAIYADRVAIDEELVRLGCHFEAMREIFEANEPIGRKLDFLMQEMNRETNTIGSKASNADIAAIVVDIKSELEKIREQIQNIE